MTQEVAQTDVVLHRPHKVYVDGQQKEVRGERLPMRLVMTRLLDEDGSIVAQWTLLTNLLDNEVSAYQVALWYYWRWLIETYFKLLKSHGQELEQWQQESGLAIARRILVASMACVMVWSLQRDDSPEATAAKNVLIRLSGRQMKHGVESTASALLAGSWFCCRFRTFSARRTSTSGSWRESQRKPSRSKYRYDLCRYQ